MNYVEKYKEAMERAKKFEEKYGGGYAGYIFPELRESEDERIRKALIQYLKDYPCNLPNGLYSRYDFFTYLEKQKENPKTADSIPSNCVSDAKCEDRWHKVEDSLPDNTREVLCKDAIGNYFIGRYYSKGIWEVSMYDDCDKSNEDNPPVVMWIDIPYEKQKEQKPILEVFGFKVGDAVRLKDGDGRKHIIKSFEEIEGLHGPNFYHVEFEDNSAEDGIYPGEEYPNGYYTQMEKIDEQKEQESAEVKDPFSNANFVRGYESGYADAKREQKSAEWSEDFDKEVENIHKRYPEVSFAKLTRIAYHFSKWANRHKDMEWSEEDEEMLNDILGILHSTEDAALANFSEQKKWLKSLRPQPSWKPSEDEERLINTSISFLKDFADKGYENAVECIDWLKSKLNQN